MAHRIDPRGVRYGDGDELFPLLGLIAQIVMQPAVGQKIGVGFGHIGFQVGCVRRRDDLRVPLRGDLKHDRNILYAGLDTQISVERNGVRPFRADRDRPARAGAEHQQTQ